jgi:hypothetical protein
MLRYQPLNSSSTFNSQTKVQPILTSSPDSAIFTSSSLKTQLVFACLVFRSGQISLDDSAANSHQTIINDHHTNKLFSQSRNHSKSPPVHLLLLLALIVHQSLLCAQTNTVGETELCHPRSIWLVTVTQDGKSSSQQTCRKNHSRYMGTSTDINTVD